MAVRISYELFKGYEMRVAGIFCLFFAFIGQSSGTGYQETQETPDNLEIVEEYVLREIDFYINEKDWSTLMLYYKHLTEDIEKVPCLRRLYPDPDSKTWTYIGFYDYIKKRFSGLPRAAIEEFRSTFDIVAFPRFREALQMSNTIALENLLEKYFFASDSDEIMERLANYYIGRGDIRRGIFHLERLLGYPFPDVSLHSAIAKLAFCYSLLGQKERIDDLKKHEKYMNENVTMNGTSQPLAKYLASVKNIKVSIDIAGEDTKKPSTELLSKLATAGLENVSHIQYQHTARITGTIQTEFPVVPTLTEIDGKQCVLIQDGERLQLIDLEGKKVVREVGVQNSDIKKPTYKPPKSGDHFYPLFSEYGPFITCQVQGNMIFANMHSPKLQVGSVTHQLGERQIRKPAPLNSLRAYNSKDLGLVFSTDKAIEIELTKAKNKDKRTAEFAKGEFSFSLPLIFKENRIYAGVIGWSDTTSIQSSYLLCFELSGKDLKLLWYTSLSYKFIPIKTYYRKVHHIPLSATFLLEKDDVIYACTNSGTVAALDQYTGRIIWLNAYWKKLDKMDLDYSRPANYPVLHKDHIYFLPMDQYEIVIVDIKTGKRVLPFKLGEAGDEWRSITHLQGILKGPEYDFLIMSGLRITYVIKLDSHDLSSSTVLTTMPIRTAVEEERDVKVVGSTSQKQKEVTVVAGHGSIIGDYILVPFCELAQKTIDDGIKVIRAGPWKSPDGSWRILHTITFKDKDKIKRQFGNLLVTGNKLILGTEEHLIIYE